MTTGGDAELSGAAAGQARHVPVLRAAVLEALAVVQDGLYLDGTFGAGGYTQALLNAGAQVVALDRDPAAVAGGSGLVAASGGRLTVTEAAFSTLEAALASLGHHGAALDGVTLDIGVSSMQIDDGARGFSFRHDGPLDMRMGREGRSAADIVNGAPAEEIADILYHFGEERASRRIARAIVRDRDAQPFLTTRPLAEMIARVCPGKPHEIHPATRTFQALRIAVNDELAELVKALEAAERVLKPGGRLAIVTFHSLEDRIVKQFLADRSGRGEAKSRLLPGEPARPAPTFAAPGKQPVLPGQDEMRQNPRARSAKLRFAQRLQAPARGADRALHQLAALPVREIKGGRR